MKQTKHLKQSLHEHSGIHISISTVDKSLSETEFPLFCRTGSSPVQTLIAQYPPYATVLSSKERNVFPPTLLSSD
ncbi:hypothetical protein L873DRAFT_1801767, partial [Choiromyces venosus 120613-1]